MTRSDRGFDTVVVGDEVESVLTAVSAARLGLRTALVRRSAGDLGGLSTRGGLSYMDITPEFIPPLFGEFLQRAGVIRVALNRKRAVSALQALLDEAGVEVLSGVEAAPVVDGHRIRELMLSDGRALEAGVLIDATPDADVARQLDVPYIRGLGGLAGGKSNYLGVTPVFRLQNVPVEFLRAFEADLRSRPETPRLLRQALPHKTDAERQELLARPTYAPDGTDYLDILNPVIGVWYHAWRHGDAAGYPQAKIYIDGGNVSRLDDGTLGFNGMIHRTADEPDAFENLLAWSHGAPMPDALMQEVKHFGRFLREEGGLAEAAVIPPDELYVRQTLTLLAKDNMTAEKALRGGVPEEKAIGTFSYWLDLRGAELWRYFPGEDLPKPIFNVGLDVTLPLWPQFSNFAFIGRSAGYSPIGQGAGRIVQHNALVGEALGIAAGLSVLSGTGLPETAANALPQIRDILAHRNGGPIPLAGRPLMSEDATNSSRVLQVDRGVVESLRESVALASGIV